MDTSSQIQDLDKLFQKADLVVTSTDMDETLTSAQHLSLYGLYKQAKKGNCQKPPPTESIALAKWDAWKSREGLSAVMAKELFLKTLIEYCPTWNDKQNSVKKIYL